MADSTFSVMPAAVAVPLLALITLILDTPALGWHMRNRNLAASSLVSWVLLSNLMNMINAFIWPTDNIASWWNGSGLCDIEVKLMVALTFGVVGSLACIMRNLAQVLDTKRTVLSPSRAERRWQMAVECLLCLGVPIYSIAVHYVVQPNRYYIFAISGCTSSFDNSWPKLALIFVWPPILCLLVVYYSVLVIIRMRRYRKDFSAVLSSSNSNMTKSRFLRLFILSMILIVVVLPTETYALYRNSVVPLVPYSWDEVHGPDWNTFEFYPSGGTVVFDRWVQIALGFAIFPFFGLGQDAKKMYRSWLLKTGCGRIFPCLYNHPSMKHSQSSLTSSRPNSLGSRVRLFFHKKQSDGSMLSSYTHRSSIPPSVATLSPVESHKGFRGLPIIIESGHRAQISPNSASSPMLKKPSPSANTRNGASWLNKIIIKAHLTALLRRGSTSSNHFGDLEGQHTIHPAGGLNSEK